MNWLVPVWLIAGREFRAYTATASFWIALVIGPLIMGALLIVAIIAARSPAVLLSVHARDVRLGQFAASALLAAVSLENHPAPHLVSGPAPGAVTVDRGPRGDVTARFEGTVPLSAEGRQLVLASIQRDDALHGADPAYRPPPWPIPAPEASATPQARAKPIGRFALVMMLWLTLTGSLGMLLQAVVRERATRALESLLAAAGPSQIVFGKLAGVGAVSLLVLFAWLGGCVALGGLAPGSGLAARMLQDVTQPKLLLFAMSIYMMAYLLFGLITVTVGAMAADAAAAQNLARPVFAVLLAVFFASLAAAGGAHHMAWLVFAPPFTPFMLLIQPNGIMSQVVAIAVLVLAILSAAYVATRSVRLE